MAQVAKCVEAKENALSKMSNSKKNSSLYCIVAQVGRHEACNFSSKHDHILKEEWWQEKPIGKTWISNVTPSRYAQSHTYNSHSSMVLDSHIGEDQQHLLFIQPLHKQIDGLEKSDGLSLLQFTRCKWDNMNQAFPWDQNVMDYLCLHKKNNGHVWQDDVVDCN